MIRKLILACALLVAACSAAGAKECLQSAADVWAKHPGSHATWSRHVVDHDGEKCWFVKRQTHTAANVVQHTAAHTAAPKLKPAPHLDWRALEEDAAGDAYDPWKDPRYWGMGLSGSQ